MSRRSSWVKLTTVILTLLVLSGWALLTLSLAHAEYGFPSRPPRYTPWFYRPLTLWAWLAGSALLVPILWFVRRRVDCAPWGTPVWDLDGEREQGGRLRAGVCWLTVAAAALAAWYRLSYGEWSLLPLAVLAAPVAVGALALLVLNSKGALKAESTVGGLPWVRLAIFVALLVLAAATVLHQRATGAWSVPLLASLGGVALIASGACLPQDRAVHSWRIPWARLGLLLIVAALVAHVGYVLFYSSASPAFHPVRLPWLPMLFILPGAAAAAVFRLVFGWSWRRVLGFVLSVEAAALGAWLSFLGGAGGWRGWLLIVPALALGYLSLFVCRWAWYRAVGFVFGVELTLVSTWLCYRPQNPAYYCSLFIMLGLLLTVVMSFRWPWYRIAGLCLAVGLTVLSGWLYTYGRHYLPPAKASCHFQSALYLSLFAWLAALVALVVPFYFGRKKAEQRRWRFARWEYPFLGVLILATLVLRVWDTGNIPPGFHLDEANEGRAALRIIHWDKPWPTGQPDPFDRGAFHHNNLPYHLFAGSLMLFKNRIVALRVVAALSGTIAIPLLYLLVREQFGRLAAVLGSMLFSTGYMAIHFARMGLGNAHTVPFAVAVVFLLWRAVARRWRPRDFLWLGLIFALSQYGLPAMRVIGVFTAMFLLYMLVTRPRQVLRPVQGWAVALLAMLITLAPMVSNYRRTHFEALSKRASEVVIWDDGYLAGKTAAQYPRDPQRYIWNNGHLDKAVRLGLSQCFDIFPCMFFGRDTSGQFGYQKGLLDFWTGVLFLGGMTFSFFSWHRPKYAMLNFWYWSTLVLGGALTVDPPFSPRLVPVIPVLAIWSGVMLAKTVRYLGEVVTWPVELVALAARLVRRWAAGVSAALRAAAAAVIAWRGRIGAAVGVAIVLALAGYNFRLYFHDYVRRNFNTMMKLLGEQYIKSFKPGDVRVVVVDPSGWYKANGPVLNYLVSDYSREDYEPLDGYLPYWHTVDKDVAFVAPASSSAVAFLRAKVPYYYPQGTFGTVDLDGKTKFVTYYATKEHINDRYRAMLEAGHKPPPPKVVVKKPDPILPQVLKRMRPKQLPKGAAAIEVAFPPWRVLAARNDTRVGIATNDFGRARTIILHPVGARRPAAIEWRGHVPAGQHWMLSFDAAGHPPAREADTGMRVYVNGEMIDQQILGPWAHLDSPWKSFQYDLSRHAGQDLTVQIWSVANGMYYEFLHIAELHIGERTEAAP